MSDAHKSTVLLTRAPLHLRSNPPRLFLLRRWAAVMARRFGGGVYLVGSALRDDNADPRDWGVRLLLTNEAFAARFATARMRRELASPQIADLWNEQYYGRAGDGRELYWKWVRCNQRVAKEAHRRWLRLYVDFQIYPPREWRQWKSHPRWKIAGAGAAAG